MNQNAWDVSRLLQRLYEGYFAYMAVRDAAKTEYGALPPRQEWVHGDLSVPRKDGSGYRFNRAHYLREAYDELLTVAEMERAWFVGALMTAADALAYYEYFDRSPCLELIYHLRNGLGHGNVFDFDRGKKRLAQYPAHNRESMDRGTIDFEIALNLRQKQVLFGYMGPGDVLDVLQAATRRLADIALGRLTEVPRAPLPYP